MKKILIVLVILLSFVSFAYADFETYDLKQNKQISFRLELLARCMFGDFDAIEHEVMFSENAELLASLSNLYSGKESVASVLKSAFKPEKAKVNLALAKDKKEKEAMLDQVRVYQVAQKVIYEHTKEGKSTFKIDTPYEDGWYVLQICKASKAKGTCLDKKVVPINDIISRYKNPKKGYQAPDSVYYYQLIEKKGNNLRFHNDIFSKEKAAEFTKVKSDALDSYSVMQSLPLKQEKEGLVIELPFFDKKKCGQ